MVVYVPPETAAITTIVFRRYYTLFRVLIKIPCLRVMQQMKARRVLFLSEIYYEN